MIDRETFINIFNYYDLNDLFYDVVDGRNFLELDDFIIYHDIDAEQVYIINRVTLSSNPIIISWYKWMHPGRSLELVGIKTKKELDNNLKLLANNLKEYKDG